MNHVVKKRLSVMKEISDKHVAILGGGACAQTFAADLTLSGYKVRLYEFPTFANRSLGDVLETSQIELAGTQLNFKWFKRSGIAKIDVVTTDISEALKGANLVLVSVPAIGHKTLFEKMINHLEDGQVVSVFPDNFGSLVLRNMMQQKDCSAKIVIGGWSSMPYGTRLQKPGKVDCLLRIYKLCYAALPSSDGDGFFNAVGKLPVFDGTSILERGDTILGVDFSNPNPIVHVPGSILNVGAMEVAEMEEGTLNIPKGRYSMYKYGMSPSVSRVQIAFYQELQRIADAMGIKIVEYDTKQFYSKTSVMGVEFLAPFIDVLVPPIVGPTSIRDRYFTEDIPIETVAYYQLAKKLNIEVPIIESLIRIGSVICGRNFLEEGRSLKDMGIYDLTKDQIIHYVRDGVTPRP